MHPAGGKLERLDDLLYTPEITIDFTGVVVDKDAYAEAGARAMWDYNPKLRLVLVGLQLLNLRRKYNNGHPTADAMLRLARGSPAEMADCFGENIVKRLNGPTISFLMKYGRDREISMVTRDVRPVIEPTLRLLDSMGVHVGRYIANDIEVHNGKLTDKVYSYAVGVDGWSGRPILTGLDKLSAFCALDPKGVYLTDNDRDGEDLIKRYIRENYKEGRRYIEVDDLPALLKI